MEVRVLSRAFGALNSAVEYFLYTEGVGGSNPSVPIGQKSPIVNFRLNKRFFYLIKTLFFWLIVANRKVLFGLFKPFFTKRPLKILAKCVKLYGCVPYP